MNRLVTKVCIPSVISEEQEVEAPEIVDELLSSRQAQFERARSEALKRFVYKEEVSIISLVDFGEVGEIVEYNSDNNNKIYYYIFSKETRIEGTTGKREIKYTLQRLIFNEINSRL